MRIEFSKEACVDHILQELVSSQTLYGSCSAIQSRLFLTVTANIPVGWLKFSESSSFPWWFVWSRATSVFWVTTPLIYESESMRCVC